MRSCTTSGSAWSPSAVEPTRSQKRTVTVLRTATGRSYAALADRDHALDRAAGALGDLRLHRHDVLPVAQRVAQLLQRDHLHVLADRLLGDGLEPLARSLLVEPVDDPGLGR